MRIRVVAEEGISAQARMYAEYRLFAALSQIAGTAHVRDARIVLRRVLLKGQGDAVSCVISVALTHADSLRIRAIGGHAYAAINRAIERLRAAGVTVVPDDVPAGTAS